MKNKNGSKRNAGRRRHHRKPSIPGTPPGTIQVDPDAFQTTIRVIAYGPDGMVEEELKSPEQLNQFRNRWPSLWIDITGLGSAEAIQGIGAVLALHPLALEDVVNIHQRAKVDTFVDSLFIVSRMVESHDHFSTEQISYFLMKGMLVSFQERPGDCWDPVRQRLRQARGRIREMGVDYLLYLLLDSVIDSYFPAMDRINDLLDQLDQRIMQELTSEAMESVHSLRGQLLTLRRAIRPHREMVNELIRDGHENISAETRVFLRDCYDHTMQVTELVDTYREITSDLRDFYLSSVSNRMNEIMKVLTIISTIFIPLSFVAGVYGMNFDTSSRFNMPELGWKYGYLFSWGIMLSVVTGLLIFFRRRKWI